MVMSFQFRHHCRTPVWMCVEGDSGGRWYVSRAPVSRIFSPHFSGHFPGHFPKLNQKNANQQKRGLSLAHGFHPVQAQGSLSYAHVWVWVCGCMCVHACLASCTS